MNLGERVQTALVPTIFIIPLSEFNLGAILAILGPNCFGPTYTKRLFSDIIDMKYEWIILGLMGTHDFFSKIT